MNSSNTGSQIWNGQQWAATAAPAAPPPVAASIIYKHGKTHAQLVQHYTNYYHLWNAQEEEARLASIAVPGNSEAIQREKWATYYSVNSAALAHYHLGISQGGAVPYQRRPQSPPVPPQIAIQQPVVVAQRKKVRRSSPAQKRAAARQPQQIQTGTETLAPAFCYSTSSLPPAINRPPHDSIKIIHLSNTIKTKKLSLTAAEALWKELVDGIDKSQQGK